jgi:DNA-binding transcriptional regulator YiaG
MEIRELRHSFALSAEAFARAIGVASGRTVRRWEAGTVPPAATAEVLLAVIAASPEAQALLGLKRSSDHV